MYIIRDDGLEFFGANIVSLNVVAIEAITIEPSPTANSVLRILQPRLKSIINRKVGRDDPILTILQTFLENCLGFASRLAVQILPLAGCVLLLGAPFAVFALENAAFRTHVVYSRGVRNKRSRLGLE